MKQSSYKMPYIPRKLSMEGVNKAVDMYRAGEPISYIALKLDCDRQTIRNIVVRLNVVRVPELKKSEGEGTMLRSSEWVQKQRELRDKKRGFYATLIEKKKIMDIAKRQENCKHLFVRKGSCWYCGKIMIEIEPNPSGVGIYNKLKNQSMV